MFKIFAIISALCAILQYVPYIRDILRGKTRPERATWLIWVVFGCIILTSQFAKGATGSLWMTVVQITGNTTVLLLSFKYGEGGITRRDLIALSAAGVGIGLWMITSQPILALIIAIVVDAIGAGLTVMKAYKEPGTETISTWILSAMAGTFSTLAVGTYNYNLLAYPIYVVIANCTTIGAIILGKKALAQNAEAENEDDEDEDGDTSTPLDTLEEPAF